LISGIRKLWNCPDKKTRFHDLTIGLLILELVGSALGFDIAAALLSIGITASTVGQIAIALVFLGLAYALRPGLPKPADGHQATRQEIPPRIMGFGRHRVGGTYVLYESKGEISYDVIAMVNGNIRGYKTFYLHDDEITIDVSGFVFVGIDATDGRYGSRVQIQKRYGLPTETAYSDAVTALTPIWTTAHRGDGTASIMLKCLGVDSDEFQEKYPHGLPVPSAVLDFPAIWDPRDVGQDPDDAATWIDYPVFDIVTTYAAGTRVLYTSDPDGGGAVYISRTSSNLGNVPDENQASWISVDQNPVLQAIHLCLSVKDGLGLDRAVLIEPGIANLIIEANRCDELVQLKNLDYQPRYVSNGMFLSETDPAEVIAAIMASCDGWMTEDGEGGLVIVVGVYRTPVATVLKAQHIVAISPAYGVEDERVVNDLQIKWTAPEHKYKEAPGQAWRDEADISLRGYKRSQTLSVPWVHYHPQARRLAKRQMARLNSRIRGTLVTKLYGMALLGERWIRLQYPDCAGLGDCIIEITKARTDIMAGRVTFDFLLINPNEIDDWDKDIDEGTPPTISGSAPDDLIPVPLDIQASAEGSPPFHIDISWDDTLREDLKYVVRYRLVDDGSGNPGPWSEQVFSDLVVVADRIMATLFPTTVSVYALQVASIGVFGTRSAWSDSVTISSSAGSLDFSLPQNSGYIALIEDI